MEVYPCIYCQLHEVVRTKHVNILHSCQRYKNRLHVADPCMRLCVSKARAAREIITTDNLLNLIGHHEQHQRLEFNSDADESTLDVPESNDCSRKDLNSAPIVPIETDV